MTAYRDGEGTRAARAALILCARCGASLRAQDELDVVCSSCDLDQPTRREAMLDAEVEAVGHEPGSYRELSEAAAELGRICDPMRLDLRCDGLPMALGLITDSGRAVGVGYSATTSGLPAARFRRETELDVEAKERAIVRELQTGDENFDRVVYIESDAADVDVRLVLEAPAVRRAILAALLRCDEVVLSADGVSAQDRNNPECYSATTIRELLTPLRVIAGAPRPVELAPEEPRSLARTFAFFAYGFLPIAVLCFWIGFDQYTPVASGELLLKGGMLGFVAAVPLQPLLTRALRGRSTSHRELVPLRFSSFVGLTLLGMALAVLLNGALDRSRERVEVTPVTAVSYDEEHPKSANVELRTSAGALNITVDDPQRNIAVGDPVTVVLRDGAFRVPWRSRPAFVTSGTKPKK